MDFGMRAGLAVTLAVLPCLVFGQDTTRAAETIQIRGRVVDTTGLPLPRTKVTLTVVGSQEFTTAIPTDEDGRFVLTSMSSQRYELRFDEPGFLSSTMRLAQRKRSNDVDVGIVIMNIPEMAPGKRTLKPITVCEVLRDLPKYIGKDFAIMGRLDCGSSLIDQTCFLAEDLCKQPITTKKYVWPNTVLIVDYWEEGMPKPPSGNPQIDEPRLVEKLSLLRKTTKLGLHRGRGQTIANRKDEWGVAYGRILSAPKLQRENCGDEMDCGGFDGAPAALIINPDSLRSFEDDTYPNRMPQK